MLSARLRFCNRVPYSAALRTDAEGRLALVKVTPQVLRGLKGPRGLRVLVLMGLVLKVRSTRWVAVPVQ
jgi:hypothetical protein